MSQSTMGCGKGEEAIQTTPQLLAFVTLHTDFEGNSGGPSAHTRDTGNPQSGQSLALIGSGLISGSSKANPTNLRQIDSSRLNSINAD